MVAGAITTVLYFQTAWLSIGREPTKSKAWLAQTLSGGRSIGILNGKRKIVGETKLLEPNGTVKRSRERIQLLFELKQATFPGVRRKDPLVFLEHHLMTAKSRE